MPNTRVFYAIQQVAFKDNASAATSGVAFTNAREYPASAFATAKDEVGGLWEAPRGVTNFQVTTTFVTEQAFQLGQLELYEVSQRQPNIQATVEKVIDGTKPIFFMVTDPAYSANIVGKTQSFRSDVALTIYADTQTKAAGAPKSIVTLSGMYLSAIQYTFPQDGPVTEQLTFVGNDKLWGLFDTAVSGHSPISSVGTAAGSDAHVPMGIPQASIASGLLELAAGTAVTSVSTVVGSGIQRREEIDISRSVLPKELPGCSGHASDTIQASGVGGLSGQTVTRYWANTVNLIEHITSITTSVDLGREDIFEAGSKRPYAKYVTFPIQTTLAIEVVTSLGDLIEATAGVDCGPDTLTNSTCIIRTCEGLQVDLGDALILDSIDTGGGGTDGANRTVTYNYKGFNTFNVTHDYFNPGHRIYVAKTPNSRFNIS